MHTIALVTPGPTEWVLILVIVLVLFGAKKLPELARSLGQSMNEFRKAREEFDKELHQAGQDLKSPPQNTQPYQPRAAGSASSAEPTCTRADRSGSSHPPNSRPSLPRSRSSNQLCDKPGPALARPGSVFVMSAQKILGLGAVGLVLAALGPLRLSKRWFSLTTISKTISRRIGEKGEKLFWSETGTRKKYPDPDHQRNSSGHTRRRRDGASRSIRGVSKASEGSWS